MTLSLLPSLFPRGARLPLGLVGLLAACTPPPVTGEADLGPGGGPANEEEILDPQAFFDSQLKPLLVRDCQICHKAPIMGADTFLKPGEEYAGVTSYRGGKFLSQEVSRSPLLTYPVNGGSHPGNNFSSDGLKLCRAWLEIEMVNRGSTSTTPATPSVPMREGDFFISLERLTKDPLSRITFKVRSEIGNNVRVSELQLSAGPMGGVKLTRPLFNIITLNGVQRDPTDTYADAVVSTAKDSAARFPPDSILLTRVPTSARLAFTFNKVETDPQVLPPLANFNCKAAEVFGREVRPYLAGCAKACHSTEAARGGQSAAVIAHGAFDMSGTLSDDAQQSQLACLRAKARVNLAEPLRSVLLLQALPREQGGTPNHPYKLGAYADYRDALSRFVEAEKKN